MPLNALYVFQIALIEHKHILVHFYCFSFGCKKGSGSHRRCAVLFKQNAIIVQCKAIFPEKLLCQADKITISAFFVSDFTNNENRKTVFFQLAA